MRRRIAILGVVAAVLVVGLLALGLYRRDDDGPTSAERATCYAVRDLEADLLDENTTIEDVSPRVSAVLRTANRTENETLIVRARRTQRRWHIYENAENQRAYDAFLRVYEHLADECKDLGVRIYLDK